MNQNDKILLKIDNLASLILSIQTRQEIMESNLTKQIEKLDTKFEEKFVLVNRRLDRLDFKVETLDKNVATLDEKVVALDEKVTTLDEKVAGLDGKWLR